MNKFVEAVKGDQNVVNNVAFTENGAIALKTSGDALVDLFATLGSMRNRSDVDIISKFNNAFKEDKLLAMKMSFYARDIRNGGIGERRLPRTIWKYLAVNYPAIMKKNISFIPEFGRWDDLFELIGTPLETDMWAVVKNQITADMVGCKNEKPISVLAKWMPSCNASSAKTKKNGLKACAVFGLTPARYRKMLSKLRSYIDVVERKMSGNEWQDIKYEGVPSKAMNNYRKAFSKHDCDRFGNYLNRVEKGEAKINAGTLYPYDLVGKYSLRGLNRVQDKVVEAQWKALPNYIDGENNIIVMADVSGSMYGRPMETSVGLALYFAERNKGAFSNLYMTFTDTPHFITVNPKESLMDKVNQVVRTDVGYGTNLERAFMAVLKTGIDNKVPYNEMPKAIVVVSDGEIDRFSRNSSCWTFMDEMRRRFANHGYELPNMVMWNVEARQDVYHAHSGYSNVQFFSGQSAATFKAVIDSIGMTPYQAMVKTLSNPVYDKITV